MSPRAHVPIGPRSDPFAFDRLETDRIDSDQIRSDRIEQDRIRPEGGLAMEAEHGGRENEEADGPREETGRDEQNAVKGKSLF